MTVFVEDAVLRDARQRAERLPLSAAERRRWLQVAAYGAARGPDPNQERAAVLRELLGLPGAGDRQVLEAAGRLLSNAVTGAGMESQDHSAKRARQLYALCRQWFEADVESAAPLLELFTGHHRDPEGGPPEPDPELVRRLGEWLARQAGTGARLEGATVIAGGFSRLMLDVRWAGGHGVVRIEQDGMFATEGRREASVMRVMRARGYPVPAILWEEPDPGVLGHPFFVMDFVEGRARTDGEGLDDVLRVLARLYGLGQAAVDEVAALDGIPPGAEPEQVIEAQLRHWHDVYSSAVTYPIPLLERGFAWLRAHLRPTGPPVVVHGDPGPGNALQDATGVAAVIDWELAHAGDAAEDWAYLALI
ncbi:MAG: phosphotransferase family protein, partial [Streptosporangiaceae bacterium]